KRSLSSVPVRLGEQYEAAKMRLLVDHISRMTSEVQLFQQLLSEGAVGEVLTKTGPEDYAGTWRPPTGGGGGGTVQSVLGTTGQISVDSTDPANPIVALAESVLVTLGLATTALQPGDNISELLNDMGYTTTTYVDDEIADLASVYQPLDSTLTALAALADG